MPKHSFAPQRASVFNCINKPLPFMQVTNFFLWMDIRMSCTQSSSTIPLGVCLFTVHRRLQMGPPEHARTFLGMRGLWTTF